jgi:hypothetical protein
LLYTLTSNFYDNGMVGSAGMARRISEKDTRKEMIDPQLEEASWYLRELMAGD